VGKGYRQTAQFKYGFANVLQFVVSLGGACPTGKKKAENRDIIAIFDTVINAYLWI
jgi:hypothetical protein